MSDFRRRLILTAAQNTTPGEIELVDTISLETIGYASREADIATVANGLDYNGSKVSISGTRLFDMTTFTGYAYAGLFTSPQPLTADIAEANKVTSLADAPDVLFVHWVKLAYLAVTIAYYSNASTATRLYGISTVPDDLFATYGFVFSTADSANNGNLVIDGTIDGKNVGNFQKTTVYTNISARPFSAQNPKTANDFNGNMGGAYQNGTNGYISYVGINNTPVGTKLHIRAYWETKDGVIVYGDMAYKTLVANTNDTGLE